MIYLLIYLLGFSWAQTSFKAITNDDELLESSFSRTVLIRSWNLEGTNEVRATGVVIKGNYIITNEHVVRPHLKDKNLYFEFSIYDKSKIHSIKSASLLGCNDENDVCLIKINDNIKLSYFSVETPPFRKISKTSPLGLYKDEEIFFNGYCSGIPLTMTKSKYVDYVVSAYEWNTNKNRKPTTHGVQFSGENGEAIACGGDSGGPLFDRNLYLYGIVRDRVSGKDRKNAKNYAVPLSIIRNFIADFKTNKPQLNFNMVTDFLHLKRIREAKLIKK